MVDDIEVEGERGSNNKIERVEEGQQQGVRVGRGGTDRLTGR